jgi:hypothetical protein
MEKILKYQFFVLLAGTLFGWGNFSYELYGWFAVGRCIGACPAPGNNPFLAPCFYGAIVFTISFILNIIARKKSKAIPPKVCSNY